MKLIMGLGNPGEKYEYTRHNVGFLMLNAFAAKKFPEGVVWLDEKKFNSHVLRFDDVLLVKPQTFMNKVGESIAKIVNYYNVELDNVLLVHDDLDLPFCEVRMKKASGSAGHHGVEDTFSALGSEAFWRIRVGIGRPENSKIEVEDYVLQKFTDEEISKLKSCLDLVFDKLEEFVKH